MPTTLRAIIADDEAPLRQALKTQLGHVWPALSICAEAENGIEAFEQITSLRPDIAFLDIRMPGMSGMQVAGEVAAFCRIVFITAYDQFAVEAFENEAVDYLLKPVEPERLARTVRRLKDRLARPAPLPEEISAALHALESRLANPAPSYLTWIKTLDRDVIRLVPVDEICCFEAQDKYTVVRTPSEEFLIRKPIRELAEELDPDAFWQIHRGIIVNAARIDKVSSQLTGRYALTLKGVEGTFMVSRRFRYRFRAM
jgi:DNA-binding LytR/AlgR family response regulator